MLRGVQAKTAVGKTFLKRWGKRSLRVENSGGLVIYPDGAVTSTRDLWNVTCTLDPALLGLKSEFTLFQN